MQNIPLEIIKRTTLQLLSNIEYGKKLSSMTNDEFESELESRVESKMSYVNDDVSTIRKGQLWFMENCITLAEMTSDKRKSYVMSQAKLEWDKETIAKADSVEELLDLL